MRKGAVIAIDHGSKKCGFAVTDPLRISLELLPPYRGDENGLLARVAALAQERDVEAFVVGMPRNMDGTEGGRARDVRGFMERLAARFPGVAIAEQDERLTTKAAEEILREQGIRGPRARELRDSVSALVLLRDWMAAGEPR